MTKKTTITISSDNFVEFIAGLKEGEVNVTGIGKFSLTKYKKKTHPSHIKGESEKKYRFLKNVQFCRVNFKPSEDLKTYLAK